MISEKFNRWMNSNEVNTTMEEYSSKEEYYKDIEQSTIFALFCPYTWYELTDEIVENEPSYPRKFRQVKTYGSFPSLVYAYANTRCPASQMIWAKDEDEFQQKLTVWNDRYDNEKWLKKNLYPYL